jgi:hypothetical protein
VTPPKGAGVRLWYDARDVPFLREDEKDSADIQSSRASTIARLVDSGFTWDSAVSAVEANDFNLLDHTGLFSVQLQPPGTVLGSPQSAAPVADPPKPDPKADPKKTTPKSAPKSDPGSNQ